MHQSRLFQAVSGQDRRTEAHTRLMFLSIVFLNLILLQRYVEAVHYELTGKPVDCNELGNPPKRIHYDSLLLNEGESLKLSCGLLDRCPHKIKQKFLWNDTSGWFIQRSRYIGSALNTARTKGEHLKNQSDLGVIRERLRRRIWPEPDKIPKVVREPVNGWSSDIVGKIITPTQQESGSANKTKSAKLLENLEFYFLVQKPNHSEAIPCATGKGYNRARIQQLVDQLYIKHALVRDTGTYSCVLKGSLFVQWVITVVAAREEPFRQTPISSTPATTKKLSTSDSSPRSLLDRGATLKPAKLLKNNLKVYTRWRNFSECSPCTVKMNTTESQRPTGSGGDGVQVGVGICYVSLYNPSHPVLPFKLSSQVEDLLRRHSPNGLPCRSHVIKQAIKSFGPNDILVRPSELILLQCSQPCIYKSNQSSSKHLRKPTFTRLQVDEGKPLIIRCPTKGFLRSKVSWYYAPPSKAGLKELIHAAYNGEMLDKYKWPGNYLATKLEPVNIIQLQNETRGRYRVNAAQNIVITRIFGVSDRMDRRMSHLVCMRTADDSSSNQWEGVVQIEIRPYAETVQNLYKLLQLLLTFLPIILSVGILTMMVVTIRTEHKPKMRLAADKVMDTMNVYTATGFIH
ncbi:unnamed protein product [Calicophoron daubneyi]|uniref:Immunoglobulin domain-containing protein n=1 Tax=Calicophoron daubneyi TaxID=300641 RepID=A0AAV2TNF7_CALDB